MDPCKWGHQPAAGLPDGPGLDYQCAGDSCLVEECDTRGLFLMSIMPFLGGILLRARANRKLNA